MKVLLVNPPARRFARNQHPSFPLGLGYVASALIEDGHDVKIYDAEWGADFAENMQPVEHPLLDMSLRWPRYFDALLKPDHAVWREVEGIMRERNPEVLGITCRVLDLASARVLARIAKSINRDMVVVLGGAAAATCGDLICKDPNVDFVVRGEGEITMVELLRSIQHAHPAPHSIEGLSFLGKTGAVKTPNRPPIREISALPYPARDLLIRTDLLPERKVAHMMGEMVTSRGCPFRCKFCAVQSVWGSSAVRLRTPQDVVGEVLHQRDRYGAALFTFWDDLFTTSRKRTVAICELLIEQDADVRWVCLVRANTVDEELLALMKRAGCVQVQMGVESGSDRILRKMRKGISVDQVKNAAEMIHRAGVSLHAFLLIGIPGETREEMEATMRLIPQIRPDCVELSVFSPYPGSPFYDELIEAGRLSEQDWLTADFLNVGRCHTGTMSTDEFRELALTYLKQCDEYNSTMQRRNKKQAPSLSVVGEA